MANVENIIRACFGAYITKDRASIESLLGPDFHFTSPLDNQIDRETYLKRCWPLSENVVDFKIVRIFVEGQTGYVTYVGSDKGGKNFRNTEFFTIQDGKISAVEVYFGWSVPHKAAPGKFIDDSASSKA